MKTLLIEAGHGGMSPEGMYMTNTKDGKWFDHGDFIAYEGVTNRAIASRLMSKLSAAGMPYVQIHHDYLDVPYLSLITDAVNKHAREKECVFLSIHSNATAATTKDIPGQKVVKGYGTEVWTSVGDTPADPIAEVLCNELMDGFKDYPKWPVRTDKLTDVGAKDKDKEKNYYVLKNTICPAVLPELLFFDERSQAIFLNSPAGQEIIANILFNWAKKIL